MIICRVCNAECEETAELCPKCGAELKLAEKSEEQEAIMVNPTLLHSFDDIVSAEIFKDVLKDSGIHFTCSSEMGDNSIQVLFGGGFVAEDIYVGEADLEKANELLEEFSNTEIQFDEDFGEEEEYQED